MLADVNYHRKYGTNQQRLKITGHIIKQKITRNYEIMQRILCSVSEMGALYVNYLQKIFITFLVEYIIHCTFSIL